MSANYEDEFDNDSGSSDDNDETMEDADDADNDDGDVEGEGDVDDDGDNDDEAEDNEGDGDNENERDNDPDMDADDDGDRDGDDGEDDVDDDDHDPESPSPSGMSKPNGIAQSAPIRSPSHPSIYTAPKIPSIREDMIAAKTYDIIPTMAAPQSTSINAVCATPNMRWVFTGGSDGYIRKFNWVDTANGKLPLTVAQKHPFVDSVTKAGVLQSYWENEDVNASAMQTPPRSFDEAMPVSPVYSLAVHHQALWLLSGDETGGINLQSVRHQEGYRITTLKKHTSAVSILNLAPDERSVLSGSWDKMIYDWDLDKGLVKTSFKGGASQISAIVPRPVSSLPVPNDTLLQETFSTSDTFSTNNAEKSATANSFTDHQIDEPTEPTGLNENEANDTSKSLNEDDLDSLFGDAETGMNLGDEDLENPVFARAMQQADANDDLFGPDVDDEPSSKIQEDEPEKDIDVVDDTQSKTDKESSPRTKSASPKPATPLNESETQIELDQSQIQTQALLLPHSIDDKEDANHSKTSSFPQTDDLSSSTAMDVDLDPASTSESTFLDASIDGTIRIWDRRTPNPVARLSTPRGTPPWCMSATWSPDGNFIYAGRRNNSVDEYSLVKGLREPTRTFRFPPGSGAVSAVHAMPSGKHLVCASYDILRLYDLEAPPPSRHTMVPFLIIPGHRTGVISQLFVDPTCSFLISTAGNRGWEGQSTEVMLGYEINIPDANMTNR